MDNEGTPQLAENIPATSPRQSSNCSNEASTEFFARIFQGVVSVGIEIPDLLSGNLSDSKRV